MPHKEPTMNNIFFFIQSLFKKDTQGKAAVLHSLLNADLILSMRSPSLSYTESKLISLLYFAIQNKLFVSTRKYSDLQHVALLFYFMSCHVAHKNCQRTHIFMCDSFISCSLVYFYTLEGSIPIHHHHPPRRRIV